MKTSIYKLAIAVSVAGLLAGCATTYQSYYPADDGYYYSDADGAYYSGASVYYEDGYYGGGSNVYFGLAYSSGPAWWPYYGPYWYAPTGGFYVSVGYWGPWYSGYVGWGPGWGYGGWGPGWGYGGWGYGGYYPGYYYPPYCGWPNYYWGYPGYNADVRREVARVVNSRPNRYAGGTGRAGGVDQSPRRIVPKSGGERTALAANVPARGNRSGASGSERGAYTTDSQGRIRRTSDDASRLARSGGQTRSSADAQAESGARAASGASSSSRTQLPASARVVSSGRSKRPAASSEATSSRGVSATRSHVGNGASEATGSPYRSARRNGGVSASAQPGAPRNVASDATPTQRRTREALRASVGGVRQSSPPARAVRYRDGAAATSGARTVQGVKAGRGQPPTGSPLPQRSYAGVPGRGGAPAPVNTAAPPPPARSAPDFKPDGSSATPARGQRSAPSGRSYGGSSRGSSGSPGRSSSGGSASRGRGGRR